ncbi:XRE family transcriptional regulator [Streptomyces sp. NPDC052503]|uniref:XRE family transcriptional regulator n=1 Tax=Streptomyces sp. NPDC052503 TaxID=3156683 RepID=UPI00136C3EEC|nr:XRE family transcriptional regulator [Streptomyces sp. SID7834]MYT56029.1 XRE family transcriptional regulator [Streptomyces sp. SID7834]MYT60721.1 XRE family transcriptional regulator [Streptomyces sp. SID7834]
MDVRPDWARRMAEERAARDWSQPDAVRALMARLPNDQVVSEQDLLRQWKRWEAGDAQPTKYRSAIAQTFGTTTGAFFPERSRRDGRAEIMQVSGMDTVDIIARLRASDVDVATLDALRITADRLCCEYAYMPADQLLLEGKAWLARVVGLQHQRVSLAQHREIIALAGKLSLLVGCVEYDSGRPRDAEATRQAALMLGQEAGELSVQGWAHEMRAWFALTRGDYRGVIAAAEAGIAVAPTESVAAQLYAQKAKAWARLGDRSQTEVALDKGRQILELQPYPENIENHFVVDPAKYDFYRMDALRQVGGDLRLAGQLANEVIRSGTDFDGTERSPMRIAEARVTLGVVAAREGDLDTALAYGERALAGERKSLPSLAMVASDLGRALQTNYGNSSDAQEFVAHLRELRGGQ